MPVAIPRKHSTLLLLAILGISVCSGCGQSSSYSKANFLASVDPQFVEQHGQLYFVNDVKVGCALAAERNQPCLFFFTAEWCTYCHLMAETTFDDARVGQLGQNFVCVLVDADRDSEVCSYFSISGFPTVEFVSPQGHSLHRLVGQQSPSDLVAGMQAALGRFAWMSDTKLR